MRIIVTGGSGFIGTNLVEHFINKGEAVINIDVNPPRNEVHREYWKKVDLLDAAELQKAILEFQPDIILHMGARTDLDGTVAAEYSANTLGVRNLISAIARLKNLQRVIFASSRLVCRIGYLPVSYDDYCPPNPYGESKVAGEQIIHELAAKMPCSWVIVRPTSIWGPWFDIPYKTFFISVAKRRYVHPGSVRVLKSFGLVGNAIHELQKILDAPDSSISGKTLYLADYPPIDVAVFADCIQREMGVAQIRTANINLLRAVAWAGDCLKSLGWRNPPLTSFRLNNLLTPMVYDLEPLRTIAGELPYSMEDGVRITVAWLRARKEVS